MGKKTIGSRSSLPLYRMKPNLRALWYSILRRVKRAESGRKD
jgi:hypothetical protein